MSSPRDAQVSLRSMRAIAAGDTIADRRRGRAQPQPHQRRQLARRRHEVARGDVVMAR